jgi:hypothetical protein
MPQCALGSAGIDVRLHDGTEVFPVRKRFNPLEVVAGLLEPLERLLVNGGSPGFHVHGHHLTGTVEDNHSMTIL